MHRYGRKRTVWPFHDHIHLGNMDRLSESAANLRELFVDFHNDHIRCFQNAFCHTGSDRQIEVPMTIHWSHRAHGYIHGQEMAVIWDQISEDHRNEVTKALVAEFSFICGTMPAVIDEVVAMGIDFYGAYRFHNQISADLNIGQFVHAFRQSRVQKLRKGEVRCIVDPVAAFDDLDRFFRGAQLTVIFCYIIHFRSPNKGRSACLIPKKLYHMTNG